MKKNNLYWHKSSVPLSSREKRNKHKAVCLWFTGLSGSGKSTIANGLQEKLFSNSIQTYLLDGDNIRMGLNSNLGFSKEDRIENIRRIGEVARLFVDSGSVIISAFISPFRADRDCIRNLLNEKFIEIFVKTDLDICINRDPKGLYKKAINGEISEFTGISSPYEEPLSPEIILKNNAKMDIESNIDIVWKYLKSKQII